MSMGNPTPEEKAARDDACKFLLFAATRPGVLSRALQQKIETAGVWLHYYIGQAEGSDAKDQDSEAEEGEASE